MCARAFSQLLYNRARYVHVPCTIPLYSNIAQSMLSILSAYVVYDFVACLAQTCTSYTSQLLSIFVLHSIAMM